MMKRLLLAACAALIGCSETSTSTELPASEGTGAAVTEVECGQATPSVTVTTPGFRFEPQTSRISAGEVVKFDPADGHDVVSDEVGQFSVPLGGAACFRFDAPGAYGFHCRPHGFTGSIEVQSLTD